MAQQGSVHNRNQEMDLLSMIKKEGIKVNVCANDWEDAILKVGELMVEIGVARPEYAEGMIKTVKEMGPYIVITKGIALPHARPEEGALKTALVIVKLKKPINFGNPDNDPVDILIGLTAVDKKSHIKALAQLARVLQQSDALKKLHEANTSEEIYDIIRTALRKIN